MGSLHWLCSYPRSGNTWVRSLLSPGYEKINSQKVTLMAAGRSLFRDMVGVDSSLLSQQEIRECRALLYEFLRDSFPDTQLIKNHDIYSPEIFPESTLSRVVCIVRNPLDVAVSLAHFEDISYQEATNFMGDRNAAISAYPKSGHHQLPQKLGTWSEHVESWLTAPAETLVLRYEDLKTDAIASTRALYEFLGYSLENHRLGEVVASSSFGKLSRREEKGLFQERWRASRNFFRRGETGDGYRELPSCCVEQIAAQHGTTMKKLGYLS